MDVELDDGRLHNERVRNRALRPVLIVVALDEMDLAAIDARAQRGSGLGSHLE